MSDPLTHFGSETLPLSQKQARVDDVFRSVAKRYDIMNDLMSFGLHRIWKDALITALKPPRHRPFRHLDLAGGTGDIAFRLLEASGPGMHVSITDINDAMLKVGRERASAEDAAKLAFIAGNAESLPFGENVFDGCSIAFGIRNVPRIPFALSDIHRVLKPGGRFVCLEFSQVDVPGFERLYALYASNVIPLLGKHVAGDADSYRYLVESIRRFPNPAAFARMIETAGFRKVKFTPMSGGIVALHSGWKL